MITLLCIITLVAVVEGILLVRAARRLFQYDDIFQEILPVLQEYGKDLHRMSSADLDGILVDHPEVASFHKRNRQAAKEIESIIDSVTKQVPPRQETPALPRPDME